MTLSIQTRVFRLTVLVNLVFSALILGFALWALEELEESAFNSDREAEIHYFYENGDKSRPHKIVTAQITAAFIPHNHPTDETLPVLFHDIPVPFEGEIEVLDKEYYVVTETLPEGNYFLAKSLSLYEAYEERLVYSTLILTLVMLIGCFVVASIFSRRISNPTLLLEKHIHRLDHSNPDARLSTDYVDKELNEIAVAVNHLLTQIRLASQRERNLISMASHELRTPVSVVLGAAHVIEKRGNLSAEDKITLSRIINASEEMSNNVRALLAVVKQSPENLIIEEVDIVELIQELKKNYGFQQQSDAQRLHLHILAQPILIQTDRALVRMLVHNLINNALNHTNKDVTITLNEHTILIQDQGDFLEGASLDLPTKFTPSSGLGLYIVTMICEKLQWKLNIETTADGHCISIVF
ncbi:MAG: HAMP domain-containing histidine kinase [Ketobacter sp.]|nr:HAMP domain-containing histidine kinase [Ketobacter sp.]